MKIEISVTPVFHFQLSSDELSIIVDAGKLHYDAVCRSAVNLGGFVYGWKNQIEFSSETPISASFRDIDTVLKILEMSKYISESSADKAEKLSHSLRTALITANKELRHILIEVDS